MGRGLTTATTKLLKLFMRSDMQKWAIVTITEIAPRWKIEWEDLRDALIQMHSQGFVEIRKHFDHVRDYLPYQKGYEREFFGGGNVEVQLLAKGKEHFERVTSGRDMKDIELQERLLRHLYQEKSTMTLDDAGDAIGIADPVRLDTVRVQLQNKRLIEVHGNSPKGITQVAITPAGREFIERDGFNQHSSTPSQTFNIQNSGSMQVATAPGVIQNLHQVSGNTVLNQVLREIEASAVIPPEEKRGLIETVKGVLSHPMAQMALGKTLEQLFKA